MRLDLKLEIFIRRKKFIVKLRLDLKTRFFKILRLEKHFDIASLGFVHFRPNVAHVGHCLGQKHEADHEAF